MLLVKMLCLAFFDKVNCKQITNKTGCHCVTGYRFAQESSPLTISVWKLILAARHRFCSIENTRLDPTSSLPAVTKSGNRMNYCGRNSSELSCMSSAAGNQSVVPGFSESPQSCCEEGARRLVDIYLPFRECKSFTHSGNRTVHKPE